MAWREMKSVVEWAGLFEFALLFWVPWGTLIRWVKEDVKKPSRRDVI